jgi:hypothetical protein
MNIQNANVQSASSNYMHPAMNYSLPTLFLSGTRRFMANLRHTFSLKMDVLGSFETLAST